jgi:hypothetical protein
MSIEYDIKRNHVLKGRLNDLPKEKPKIVCVFLSSTFTGLKMHIFKNKQV